MPPRKKRTSKKASLRQDVWTPNAPQQSNDHLQAPQSRQAPQPRPALKLVEKAVKEKASEVARENFEPRRSARIAQRQQFSEVAPEPASPATKKSPDKPSQPPIVSERQPKETGQKQVTKKKPSAENVARAQAHPPSGSAQQEGSTPLGKQSFEKAIEQVPRKTKRQKNLEIKSWIPARRHPKPVKDLDTPKPIPINEDMAKSSVTSYTEPLTSVQESQQQGGTPKGRTNKGQDACRLCAQLEVRNADPRKRTNDPLLKTLKGLLNVEEQVKLLRGESGQLREIIRRFTDKFDTSSDTQDVLGDFELFQNQMNSWKPGHKLFTLTNDDFDFDRQHSRENNEAVLQRTVLTSIIDRWRLNKMFTFNCEGQWRMSKEDLLPTRKDIQTPIGGLKADLTVFYRFELFAGTEYNSITGLPQPLQILVFPDENTFRCFPFIFVEAKKGEKDLAYAKYSNMLNASQALWNIYKWMKAGNQLDAFFDHVRVFTISLNADKLVAHVHRAEPFQSRDTPLRFLWDELHTLPSYSRDGASLLIRNLLLEYGVARLRGYLIAAYETIINAKLPTLREIPELWEMPEIRDAVTRKEAFEREAHQMEAVEREALGVEAPEREDGLNTTHGAKAVDNPEVSPVQAEGSKRGPPAKPSGRAKRPKGGKGKAVDPNSSFGASGLNLGR